MRKKEIIKLFEEQLERTEKCLGDRINALNNQIKELQHPEVFKTGDKIKWGVGCNSKESAAIVISSEVNVNACMFFNAYPEGRLYEVLSGNHKFKVHADEITTK